MLGSASVQKEGCLVIAMFISSCWMAWLGVPFKRSAGASPQVWKHYVILEHALCQTSFSFSRPPLHCGTPVPRCPGQPLEHRFFLDMVRRSFDLLASSRQRRWEVLVATEYLLAMGVRNFPYQLLCSSQPGKCLSRFAKGERLALTFHTCFEVCVLTRSLCVALLSFPAFRLYAFL